MEEVSGLKLAGTARERACPDRWLVAEHIQAAEGCDHCDSKVEVAVVVVELGAAEAAAAPCHGANDALRVPGNRCC